MYRIAVVLAVGAALLIAIGAALQSRTADTVRAPTSSRISFLLLLIRQPRWLAGGLTGACGVGVHVVALSLAPVSAVQPVGTVGLIFAVWARSVLDRVRPSRRTVAGSVLVIAGLTGFLLVLPPGQGVDRVPSRGAVGMAAIALGVAFAALALPREPLSVNLRAAAVAAGAGASFGVGAALIGVIGRRAGSSIAAVLAWPSLLVIVLIVVGGCAQQYAYGLARFAEVYAVVLVADPLMATLTGVLVLGDPFPTSPADLAWLAIAAAVTTAGVVVLSRDHPGHSRKVGVV